MHRLTIVASVILTGATVTAFQIAQPSKAAGSDVTGRASVVDADTIDIHGERIRLDGIDAPESWQTCEDAKGKPYRCGKAAAEALDRFLAASRPTTCTITGSGGYGRAAARCKRADGRSVNSWLVRSGWALDWPKYSKGDFAADEAAAKAENRGIWKGAFEDPCVVRAKRAKREPRC